MRAISRIRGTGPLRHMWAPWRIKYVTGAKPQGCVLCQKAQATDDVAEQVLYRATHNYVILNAYPYNSGHLMVVPYRHVGDLTELGEAECNEMMRLTQVCMRALRRCLSPDGVNVGMNIGKAAGAGIDEHIHLHVVPRWAGDTNFMTTVSDTRVVPQSLDDTCALLAPLLAEEAEAG